MNKNPRFFIPTLIFAGYVMILGALIGLGWFATSRMEQMHAITQGIYQHPFAVSNAATSMKGSILLLHTDLVQIAVVRNGDEDYAKLVREIRDSEKEMASSLKVIKENFLGDQSQVRLLETRLAQWNETHNEILSAMDRGDVLAADRLVRNAGIRQFEEIVPIVDYVLMFAKEKGRSFAQEAESKSESIINSTIWTIALIIIAVIATGVTIFARIRSLQDELVRQATLDFLTGIPNRRSFMEFAERELHRSMRRGDSFALAVVDLDFFKAINDTYGHQAGDHVLKNFCAVGRKALRDTDIIGRIGGEEFAILLPNTTRAQAEEVLERVRNAVADAVTDIGHPPPIQITASFGLAVWAFEGNGLDDLFKRADSALYAAKSTGRNRICVL